MLLNTKNPDILTTNNKPITDPELAYNDLPLLPPQIQISEKINLKCSDARAALAELKGAINTIPNSDVLINTLPLLETHSSNKIENIVTTQDQLFRFSALDNLADPVTKESLRYRTALKKASDLRSPINIPLIQEICSTIHNKKMDIRSTPVFVGSPNNVIYTPPDDQKILINLLDNWLKFIDHSRFDPLVRMAILHYQFEAIHPFIDGNGRTGRILNLLFLMEKNLLDSPILYLSRYILQHRSEYYRLLTEVTQKANWEDWILYMLSAVETTSQWTLSHVHSIKKLMDHTSQYLSNSLPSASYKGLLMDVLFTYPYCRNINLRNLGIKSPITSRKYLRMLVKLGILEEEHTGKELIFVHKKYLKLIMASDHKFTEYKPLVTK